MHADIHFYRCLSPVLRASPIEPHGNSLSLPLASFMPLSSAFPSSRASTSHSASSSSSTSLQASTSTPSTPNLLAAQAEIKNWATGADSDIGGHSWCKLEPYPLPLGEGGEEGKGDVEAGARFYGNLSSAIRPGMKLGGNKVDRSGYAGIRTKVGQIRRYEQGCRRVQ